MPIREELSASPATLADVLGNGKRYAVPRFQRDYAWDEPEWAELWADIRELIDDRAGGNHYLGELVLQPTSERGVMYIIDGQQRLVTLSLLALAVIIRIETLAEDGHERDDNLERARLLRERFVSTRDSASLQHRSRLELNATDNGFYQTYLVQGRAPRVNTLRGSERKLYRAFEYFGRMLTDQFGDAPSGATLAHFLDEVLAGHLRFISISVQNDETAFIVFETLNARGVALGTGDLLKNFLFTIAQRGGASDLEQAQWLWERVLRAVPMPDVATLLFHKLAATVPDLREKRVFAEVKRLVPASQSVFDFLRDLAATAELYAALDDPDDELWADVPGARRNIRILSTIGVDPYRSLVLAACAQFAERPDKLGRVLHNLVMIASRALVVRVNSGDAQRASQSTALRIARGELRSPLSIAGSLADIMPSDDDFKAAFAVLSVDPKGPRKRWLRYVLGALEVAAGGAAIDFEMGAVNLEHVLPENPGPGWDAFSAEDRRRYTARLGNLTPLEHALNRRLGASDFDAKRALYAESRYRLTNTITAPEWTPEVLRQRQEHLANLAVGIWRIDPSG